MPFPCTDPDCGGSIFMPRTVWEEAIDYHAKNELQRMLVLNPGAMPGQEV